MRALALLAVVPVVLWLIQAAALAATGRRVWRPLSAGDLPRGIKRLNRGATYASFAVLLIVYPLLRGVAPWAYYAQFFPRAGATALLFGAAASIIYLTLLYGAWWVAGSVGFEVRDPPGRLVRHLAGVPLTALLAAGAEELLFRGVLLSDLLASFDARVAVPLGALVFAGADYVRSVKRYWTFPGHVGLGLLLCVAFSLTQALWLPLGLHAGGIIVLMGVRPFIRYRAPAWLVGASIYPYAGVVGITALGLLTVNVWLAFGAAP